MDFSSLKPLGIGVAVVAGFTIGAFWLSPKTFFPLWWKALDKGDSVPGEGQNMGVVFGSLVFTLCVQAIVLAGIINGLYGQDASLLNGVVIGAVLGLGISGMHSLGHRLFASQGWLVWAIEMGNDVVVTTTMAAVITLIN